MNDFPDRQKYEALYRRFFKEDDLLLKLADLKPGEAVLDLCAGGLRQSCAALAMGASTVWVVEENGQMLPDSSDMPDDKRLQVSIRDVKWFLTNNHRFLNKFDVACCQQAVNYWFDTLLIGQLRRMLSDKGRFVFNTFNTMPPLVPTFKSYNINGLQYGEAFYTAPGGKGQDSMMVHHLQMCESLPPHLSSFAWIPPEAFMAVLKRDFASVHRITRGKTDYYVCWVKPTDFTPLGDLR